MKKKISKPLNELAVDVVDYMFVEWLVRSSLYSRFAKNLARFYHKAKPPRSIIREMIRMSQDSPFYSYEGLVLRSFPFNCTPEGIRFWARVSSEWVSYFRSFSKTI